MIADKIRQAFNDQVKYEAESAYLYFAMAAWFQQQNLDGMATWMRAQAVEEMGHAHRFSNHIIDRDGTVTFQPLQIGSSSWKTPLDAFEAALEHERFITKRINDLVELSYELKDRAARTFLEWFVNEQVEEEKNAGKIVADLNRIGDNGYGLLMLDRELGQRPITMPTTTSPAGGGAA